MTPSPSFPARLHAACRAKRSVVCVGLDPRFESLPAEFSRGRGGDAAARAEAFALWGAAVLDVIAPLAPIVKPQSAFYEALGLAGVDALHRTIAAARERGLLVILDAKRGDMNTTAMAYAEAHLAADGADALTVNPYLGRDALEPFVARCRGDGKGLFVLVKTSNPGSADFQDLELAGGGTLYERVADAVSELGATTARDDGGWNSVGAVIGATHPAQLAALRARIPHTPLLVPGYGAQGGAAEDCRGAFGADGLGAVVSSSRGLTFAFRAGAHATQYGEARWRDSVAAATTEMRDALNAVRAGGAG